MNEERSTPVELQHRTKEFALRVIRLFSRLPETTVAQTIGKQVLRSGTSAGANYREACRARSTPEFISKLGIVAQELEETLYWMELLIEAEIVAEHLLQPLMTAADELLAIVTASTLTAKRRTTTE